LYCTNDFRTMLKLAHTQDYFQVAQLHFVPREPLKPIFDMLSERRRDNEASSCNLHGLSSFQAE
jgi:hypothetical protein